MRIIAVVMGEPDSKTRNAEVTSMLDYAFAQYEVETVLSTDSVLGKKKVDKGEEEYATIVPIKNINILYKKTDNRKNVTYNVKVNDLKAPIKKGEVVGIVEVKDGDTILNTIDVTITNDIKKANVFKIYLRNLKNIFNGNI